MIIEYISEFDIKEKTTPKKDVINQGSVIINDKGLYGDWLINHFGDDGIIKYPSYDSLITDIKQILEKKPIIILFDTQKKEIELLKNIFPIKYIELDMDIMLQALGLNLQLDDLYELCKKNKYYRILYLIMRFRLNPSYAFTLDYKKPYFPYEENIKKLNLILTSRYMKEKDKFGQVFNSVILDLAYIDDRIEFGEKLDLILENSILNNETIKWLTDKNIINK